MVCCQPHDARTGHACTVPPALMGLGVAARLSARSGDDWGAQSGPGAVVLLLLIRMLIVGYAFAIRSERALCLEVQVNLAYR
jgi:hypothetical protein